MSYSFVALDVETANPDQSSICQVGLVKFVDGNIAREESILINPDDYFDPYNVSIHGITQEDVADAPSFSQAYETFIDWIEREYVIHHGPFDRVAFAKVYKKNGLQVIQSNWIDNIRIVRRTWDEFKKKGYGLANLATHFGLKLDHHEALSDARVAGQIALRAFEDSGKNPSDWVAELGSARLVRSTKFSVEPNPEGIFFGQTILFTGALHLGRDELTRIAGELGFQVARSASKKVDILAVGLADKSRLNGYEKSGKHRRIEQLIGEGHNIQIISDDDLAQLFNMI